MPLARIQAICRGDHLFAVIDVDMYLRPNSGSTFRVVMPEIALHVGLFFTVKVHCGLGQRFVALGTDGRLPPVGLRALVEYRCQGVAFAEGPLPYAFESVGYTQNGQAVATVETFARYLPNRIGDRHRDYLGIASECSLTHCRHGQPFVLGGYSQLRFVHVVFGQYVAVLGHRVYQLWFEYSGEYRQYHHDAHKRCGHGYQNLGQFAVALFAPRHIRQYLFFQFHRRRVVWYSVQLDYATIQFAVLGVSVVRGKGRLVYTAMIQRRTFRQQLRNPVISPYTAQKRYHVLYLVECGGIRPQHLFGAGIHDAVAFFYTSVSKCGKAHLGSLAILGVLIVGYIGALRYDVIQIFYSRVPVLQQFLYSLSQSSLLQVVHNFLLFYFPFDYRFNNAVLSNQTHFREQPQNRYAVHQMNGKSTQFVHSSSAWTPPLIFVCWRDV